MIFGLSKVNLQEDLQTFVQYVPNSHDQISKHLLFFDDLQRCS